MIRITGWWPFCHTTFTLHVAPSLGATGGVKIAASAGLSVPPTLTMAAVTHTAAAFTLDVTPSLGAAVPTLPYVLPFQLGE